MESINYPLIIGMALVAMASPGPATLAIAGTAMAQGRKAGFVLASGILLGSLTWSIAAALGMGAAMVAHGWVLEVLRYVGAGYLMFLAWKTARRALSPADHANSDEALQSAMGQDNAAPVAGLFFKGLALHLTNPKAIFFFGALYATTITTAAAPADLARVIGVLGFLSATVFFGYALAFSSAVVSGVYLRSQRMFDALFAVAFGAAGVKILTTRLSD